MKNKRGFTLVEVLLAAMIVGLIGVALSALTTAAIRESNVGRTRMILRNQLSLAMRQLRQDIHQSTEASANGGNLVLYQNGAGGAVQLGPDHQPKTITYSYNATCNNDGYACITRQVEGSSPEVWLPFVKSYSEGDFVSPRFRFIHLAGDFVDEGYNAPTVLQVQMILEIDTNPVVNDAVDETFVLPHGISIRHVAL